MYYVAYALANAGVRFPRTTLSSGIAEKEIPYQGLTFDLINRILRVAIRNTAPGAQVARRGYLH